MGYRVRGIAENAERETDVEATGAAVEAAIGTAGCGCVTCVEDSLMWLARIKRAHYRAHGKHHANIRASRNAFRDW